VSKWDDLISSSPKKNIVGDAWITWEQSSSGVHRRECWVTGCKHGGGYVCEGGRYYLHRRGDMAGIRTKTGVWGSDDKAEGEWENWGREVRSITVDRHAQEAQTEVFRGAKIFSVIRRHWECKIHVFV
jgi:hypothetical protein